MESALATLEPSHTNPKAVWGFFGIAKLTGATPEQKRQFRRGGIKYPATSSAAEGEEGTRVTHIKT